MTLLTGYSIFLELQILLDSFTNIPSPSEHPQETILHCIPSPDHPLSPPLISYPVPPFSEFNADMNTESTKSDNLHEHSSKPCEGEPCQDTNAISHHEAQPTMPTMHVSATRVDSDNPLSMHSLNADSVELVAAQNPFSYSYGSMDVILPLPPPLPFPSNFVLLPIC